MDLLPINEKQNRLVKNIPLLKNARYHAIKF